MRNLMMKFKSVDDEIVLVNILCAIGMATIFLSFMLCIIVATLKAILTLLWLDFGYNFNNLIIMKLDNITLFSYISLFSLSISMVLGIVIYFKVKS